MDGPPRRRTPPVGTPILPDGDAVVVLGQQVVAWRAESCAYLEAIDQRLERMEVSQAGARDLLGHLSEQLAVSQTRAEEHTRRLDQLEADAREAKSLLASQKGARGFGAWVIATLLAVVAILLNVFRHR